MTLCMFLRILYHFSKRKFQVFWVGPLLGAIFAAVSYRSLFDPTEPPQVRTDPAAINLRNNSHKTDEDA